jgi:hypothetical protein
MIDRHLLPDELDRLLDGDVGFARSEVEEHLATCPQCRRRLEEADRLLQELERAPRFAPSHDFADRVMRDVTVFVPWHVALRDTVTRALPAPGPARAAAAAFATGMAAVVTFGIVWLLSRTDLLVFAASMVGSRIRDLMVNASGTLVVALFGQQATDVFLRTSTLGLTAILLVVVGASIGALLSLRAIALAVARRRR